MQSQSRTVNSIKNIITGFAGQFIQIILGFISRSIFIKFLAAEYLGISGLFTNILSMLSLAELGVGSAIIYALYRPLAEKDEKELAVLMQFYAKTYKIIGTVIMLVGILIMPFLKIIIKDSPNIKESLYVIYVFYLFNTSITYFYSYKSSIIVADQKNYIISLVSYGVTFIQTILQIIVLIITRNFLVYLVIQTICLLTYNLVISKTADKMYPFLKTKTKERLSERNKNNLIKNIKALMIVKLSGVLVNNTDNIIITYFSGLSMVGLCSNYNMLIGIINTALSQIFGGITASVGNLNANEGKERQRYFFDIMNFANFWMFGFSSIGIVILINDIIRVWLGTEYILPFNITIILAINFYMVGMQNAVWTFKNTLGLFRQGRYLLLVTAFINLVLSIILGDKYGLFGILLATAISRLLTNAWYDPYVVYKYGLEKGVKEYIVRYFKFICVFIITITPTFFITNLIEVNSMVTVIMKMIVCTVVSNSIFIAIFYKTKEFTYFKYIFLNSYNKFSKKIFKGMVNDKIN